MAGLTYIGNGRFLPGVPARDLGDADLELLELRGKGKALLLSSGLYEDPTPPRPKRKATPKKTTTKKARKVLTLPAVELSEEPNNE